MLSRKHLQRVNEKLGMGFGGKERPICDQSYLPLLFQGDVPFTKVCSAVDSGRDKAKKISTIFFHSTKVTPYALTS